MTLCQVEHFTFVRLALFLSRVVQHTENPSCTVPPACARNHSLAGWCCACTIGHTSGMCMCGSGPTAAVRVARCTRSLRCCPGLVLFTRTTHTGRPPDPSHIVAFDLTPTHSIRCSQRTSEPRGHSWVDTGGWKHGRAETDRTQSRKCCHHGGGVSEAALRSEAASNNLTEASMAD